MHNARKHLLWLLLALPTLVCAATPVLTSEGYGAVRFGMPIADVEKALRQAAKELDHQKDCQYVRFRKYRGIRFLVEAGIVVRAHTRKSLRNSAGARIGMDMQAYLARHPFGTRGVRDVDQNTVMYRFESPDSDAALVLLTVGGKVREMWAGSSGANGYADGCAERQSLQRRTPDRAG